MKIRFNPESHGQSSGKRFRKIEEISFPQVYQGLLLASDPEEYRIYAGKIRALAKKVQLRIFFVCILNGFLRRAHPKTRKTKLMIPYAHSVVTLTNVRKRIQNFQWTLCS